MLAYLGRLATMLSQVANTLVGGNPDSTLSARLWVAGQLGDSRAARAVAAINALFFWQENHCRGSWARDVVFAQEVLLTVDDIVEHKRRSRRE